MIQLPRYPSKQLDSNQRCDAEQDAGNGGGGQFIPVEQCRNDRCDDGSSAVDEGKQHHRGDQCGGQCCQLVDDEHRDSQHKSAQKQLP